MKKIYIASPYTFGAFLMRIKHNQKDYRELCEYIFDRDKWCVFCGNPHTLTPAHIKRRSQGGNDSPNNMVAACVMRPDGSKGCHNRFDDREIPLPGHIEAMLEKEPLYIKKHLIKKLQKQRQHILRADRRTVRESQELLEIEQKLRELTRKKRVCVTAPVERVGKQVDEVCEDIRKYFGGKNDQSNC